MRGISGVLVVAVALLAGCGGSHAALRLARAPYLGLASCGHTSAGRCERLGFAVWLPRPARKTAVVDGVSVRLRPHSGGGGAYRGRLFWQGFFRDPRARQLAQRSAFVPVQVRVTAPDGSISAGLRRVEVSGGYG